MVCGARLWDRRNSECPVSIRFDRAPLSQCERLPDGRLRVRATFSRVGPLNYLRADGTIQQEIVTADELFREDSLETAGLAPVTLGHPPDGMVTPKTWKKYAVGASGSTVLANRVDGLVDVVFVIGDEEAIEAVESGKATEVSAGYSTLVEARGDGKFYQTNRQYNHLAIVERGRAGPGVRLHIDAADDWAVMADEAELNNDAKADNETLVLLAAKAIYEQSNWEVLGIRNLVITPGESLTVEVVIENEDTNDRVIVEAEYDADANEWTDKLLSESKSDEALDLDQWRVDAGKKGGKRGKRTTAPKCNKGRPCGMSCIANNRNCKQNPQGDVEEALKQAVGSGSQGSGGASSKQAAETVSTGVSGLKGNEIVVYTGSKGSNGSPSGQTETPYFDLTPDPGTKKMSIRELRSAIFKEFNVKNQRELMRSGLFKMATDGGIDLDNEYEIRSVYRRFVGLPRDEANPPPGPSVINGVNIMRNFLPWDALGFKTQSDVNVSTAASVKAAYRKAVLENNLHPDLGGDPRIFDQLTLMRDSLLAAF